MRSEITTSIKVEKTLKALYNVGTFCIVLQYPLQCPLPTHQAVHGSTLHCTTDALHCPMHRSG